jgi:hypothetical protein
VTLSDYLTSVIRTLVPILWGTALAWLVSVGVLDQAAAAHPGAGVGGFLVTLCVGAFYILARAAEPHLPPLLATLLFGRAQPPRYPTA